MNHHDTTTVACSLGGGGLLAAFGAGNLAWQIASILGGVLCAVFSGFLGALAEEWFRDRRRSARLAAEVAELRAKLAAFESTENHQLNTD